MMLLRIIVGLLFFIIQTSAIHANVIVRMEVIQGPGSAPAQTKFINIRLFDSITPLTVINFLRYANTSTINGGSYNKSFVHRSVSPAFIIQGGGFTFDPDVNDGSFSNDPALDNFPGGLQIIPRDPTVDNEFRLSNVRGTIAMAKPPGQPNGASSEWFINVIDNASLDTSEGGFTVFGEVLSDSLQLIDEISLLPIFDQKDVYFALNELPLIDYNGTDPILEAHLVRIETIKSIANITDDIDFGNIIIGSSVQREIVIENIREVDLVNGSDVVIGDIANLDVINTPFSIVPNSDNCSNRTLVRTETCSLMIAYSPQIEADNVDTFNVVFTSPAMDYRFQLQGRAADSFFVDVSTVTVELNIFSPENSTFTEIPSDGVDFGELQFVAGLSNKSEINLGLKNNGNMDLIITAIDTNGSEDFFLRPNCLTISPIAPGDFCIMPTAFTPTRLGRQTATVTIQTNDLQKNPLIIPIFGSASIDVDSIPVEIEDSSPNAGDNNVDGILDSIQNNVGSFVGKNGQYISLVANEGLILKNVKVLDNNQLLALPEGIFLNLGIFDFSIENLVPGAAVPIGIVLPQGVIVDSYYMFGPTPDNLTPHWYEFLFDGRTGAVILGDVTFTNPSDGSKVIRSVLTLFFVDGERGDFDLTSNGVILNPGGPVIQPGGGTSSGGMLNIFVIFSFIFLTSILRLQNYSAR